MVATRNARPSWPTIEVRKEVDTDIAFYHVKTFDL